MLESIKHIAIRFFCLDHKFLVLNLIRRNLKVKYRQSIGGLLWTLLIPLCTSAVFYFVFKFYMRIQAPHYLGLIISGVIPWGFFSNSVLMGTESLVHHANILSKVPLKANAFPLTDNLTQFINSFLGLPVIFAVLIFDGVTPSYTWALYPLLLVPLFLISYSMTYLLSIFYVFFRDLRYFLSISMQMLFYLTPVIYPYEMVPEAYRIYFSLSPVAGFFMASQDLLVNGVIPSTLAIVPMLAWAFVLVTICAFFSVKFQGEVIENL